MGREMDTQNVVQTYNGLLFSLRKEELLTQAATWTTVEDIMLGEISQS